MHILQENEEVVGQRTAEGEAFFGWMLLALGLSVHFG